MLEEDESAGQMKKAEVVFDVILPPHHQATVVAEPGEEAFDLPAPGIAAQRPAILRDVLPAAVAPVRGDHFRAVLLHHLVIQPVAVVGLVPDQPFRHVGQEALVDRLGPIIGCQAPLLLKTLGLL